MTAVNEQLKALRNQIDSIDEQILSLISERARCAQQVAEVKKAEGGPLVYYRPEREAQVLRAIMDKNKGPIADEDVARLFREIMSVCLALEQPIRVAFLGPEGTFTQAAVLKHFGQAVVCMPHGSIGEVFREVEADEADYGIVPVENSTEGVINHTLDSFIRSPLNICGEVELRIHHHLLRAPDAEGEFEKIYSHQQSLAQCRNWLDTRYPNVVRIAVSSNAEAARRAQLEPNAAAIAGDMAADIYQLEKLASNIEDEPDNTTRFLVIGKHSLPPSGHDKTTLLVSAQNQPGSLYQILEPFAKSKVSMTRIESRPSRHGMWEYVFFIDIEGHCGEQQIKDMLDELRKKTILMKSLGSYPKAVL